MKNVILRKIFAFLLVLAVIFSYGCTGGSTAHTHNFNKKASKDEYLKEAADCTHGSIYYYSCECGEKGDKTYDNLVTAACDFTAKTQNEKYLKQEATCQKGAEYYMSCSVCGKASTLSTFFSNELGEHSYVCEQPDGKFIKEEATETASAVYYKSCACGEIGEETFVFGEPLREYSYQEKLDYTPTSLTVSLYDTENSVYGFTYNTLAQPLRPVIQISETTDFSNATEYPAHTEKYSTITKEQGGSFTYYYIVKAEIALEAGKTYYYKAYDKYVKVGSRSGMLTAKDLSSDKFTFAHVSDSQSSDNSGLAFGKVLASVTNTCDFVVHTGDVVENSLYEEQWTNMLHANFEYLSKIPVMAISGNHETTYKNGSYETVKHFNNKMPDQDAMLGYYYSFTYGNAKFIMLNTNKLNGNQLTNEQYAWLISELEGNSAKWTFVAMHNPMYSAGTYGSNPERNQISLALRSQLHDIFVKYGVDVVLQGHDHLISKTYPLGVGGGATEENLQKIDGIDYSVSPEGVIYVMSGTAGEQTRTVYQNNSLLYNLALDSQKSSWSEFSIDGDTLTVTVKTAKNGNPTEIYKWGVKKN